MKRYHLFCGDTYSPGGGMGDYHGSFATREEAMQALHALKYKPDWAHIVTTEEDGALKIEQEF